MAKELLESQDIANFTNQLAIILHAGISPFEGIAIMKEENDEKCLEKPLEIIYDQLNHGKSLYESLKASQVFNDYILNMVHIGESAGQLENVMNSLSLYYQRLHDNNESIKAAISYPLIMIIMMIVVIIVLITQVLPIFSRVFEQLGSSMTGFSKMVLDIGVFISTYAYVFIGILLILCLLSFYFIKTKRGNMHLTDFLAKAKFSRNISMKLALSKFTSGMAIALSSGLDIDESLQMSKNLIDNKVLLERIEKALSIMKEKDIASGLVEAKVLTGMYARLIKIGHKTGGMDMIMQNIADQYDQETNESIHHMISIIEPTLVAILSILVGLILLSVMMPLIGIMSSL